MINTSEMMSAAPLVRAVEEAHLRSDRPHIESGDTVRVHVKVVEGSVVYLTSEVLVLLVKVGAPRIRGICIPDLQGAPSIARARTTRS